MATNRISRIQLKRDTAANWTAINPVLFAGEAGYESDTAKLKIGDGITHWNSLPYISGGGGGGGSGTSGTSGSSGSSGTSGMGGSAGTSGQSGPSGTHGSSGSSGTSGTSPTIVASENYLVKVSSGGSSLVQSIVYDDGYNISISGSAVITGSLTVTGPITGSILSASYSVTSSATTLQQSITPNQNVGGIISGVTITSGRTIEDILRTMLVAYTPPTLSSLSMRLFGSTVSTATRDVNNSFQVNSASFNVGVDSPGGIGPISSSWASSGADVGALSYYFGDAPLAGGSNVLSVGSTYTINRATSGGTVIFTVNGKRSDIGTFITGTSTSVSFRFRNYMAASSTDIISNVTAQSVIDSNVVDSLLDDNRVWTATCSAANDVLGNYTYILYPASYGDLSTIIQNGALPVLTAFTKLGDYTITNAYGASVSVRVYKSNSDKAFSSGTTLAIS